MANKKEFLYILTLCFIAAIFSFGFWKPDGSASIAAASLTSAPNNADKIKNNNKVENNADISADSLEILENPVPSLLQIPDLPLGLEENSEDASNFENSLETDFSTNSDGEAAENFASPAEAFEAASNPVLDLNPDNLSSANSNLGASKESQAIKLDKYQERNQIKGEKIKIDNKVYAEKGTIFDAHKTVDKNSLEKAPKLEIVESKIIAPQSVIGSQKAAWIEPVIKNSGDAAERQNSDSLSAALESQAGQIFSGASVKEISILDKKEIAGLKTAKFSSSSAPSLDSDSDGIADDVEKKLGSNPQKADSDGDGFSDGVALSLGYNPNGKGVLSKNDLSLVDIPQLEDSEGNSVIVDSDNDGISDKDEIIFGIDPFNSDSDGDGFSDGEEIIKGFNPLESAKEKDDKIALENPASSLAPIAENLTITSIARNIEKSAKSAAEEKLSFEGAAEPNSFIVVYVFSSPAAAVVKTDAIGKWVYNLDKALDYGEHTVYTAVVDASGAIIAKSNPVKFLLEEIKIPAANLGNIITPETAQAEISSWMKDPKTIVFSAAGIILLIVIGAYAIKEIKG